MKSFTRHHQRGGVEVGLATNSQSQYIYHVKTLKGVLLITCSPCPCRHQFHVLHQFRAPLPALLMSRLCPRPPPRPPPLPRPLARLVNLVSWLHRRESTPALRFERWTWGAMEGAGGQNDGIGFHGGQDEVIGIHGGASLSPPPSSPALAPHPTGARADAQTHKHTCQAVSARLLTNRRRGSQ